MPQDEKITNAVLGDIHVTETSYGKYQQLFSEISDKADVLVLCGDLTDHGTPNEAKVLCDELQVCAIPTLAVLGNHDHESSKHDEVKKILRDSGSILLEDEVFIYKSVGFTGVKGFGGG